MGVSKRTVIRYLKQGKIPTYKRTSPTKKDPLDGFYDFIKETLEETPTLSLPELYVLLDEKGYQGSERTLRRKTKKLRDKLAQKEVFFQRAPTPGEVIEGDFTELHLSIGGVKRVVYLWVSSMPYSNAFFATPFYHQTFECFALGSALAFEEFGGVAKKFRLDNMSPAVTKILKGKERLVTQRYAAFQQHYGFFQDFCNPASGNEKGNVESNNKWLKRKILNSISVNKLSFKDLNSFQEFVWKLCRDHNEKDQVQKKFNEEILAPLPKSRFGCFSSEVAKVSKYSLFSVGKSGHSYSAPSQLIGLRLEARVYPNKIELIDRDEVVASHKRLYGPRGLASIQIEHVLDGLLRKPGAVNDWKHREVLFKRPVWRKFFEEMKGTGVSNPNKTYLACLKLMAKHGEDNLTVAMEMAMEEGLELNNRSLKDLLEQESFNVYEMKPLEVDLGEYDQLLTGGRDDESKRASIT